MPYFIYAIQEAPETGRKTLSLITTEANYKKARTLVREKRSDSASDDENDYRMIFAQNETEAEKLLSTPRDTRVVGED